MGLAGFSAGERRLSCSSEVDREEGPEEVVKEQAEQWYAAVLSAAMSCPTGGECRVKRSTVPRAARRCVESFAGSEFIKEVR